jgi:hypothetical protein
MEKKKCKRIKREKTEILGIREKILN